MGRRNPKILLMQQRPVVRKLCVYFSLFRVRDRTFISISFLSIGAQSPARFTSPSFLSFLDDRVGPLEHVPRQQYSSLQVPTTCDWR